MILFLFLWRSNPTTTLMPFTFKRHWEFIEKRFLLFRLFLLLSVDKLLMLYIQHFEIFPSLSSLSCSTTIVKWIFDMASVVVEGELLRHNTAIEFHLKLNKFYYMPCYAIHPSLVCVSILDQKGQMRSKEKVTCTLNNVKSRVTFGCWCHHSQLVNMQDFFS